MEGIAVLPAGGRDRLCLAHGASVSVLAELPGADDARYFPDYAARRLAVLDSSRKRVGLFELLDREPWVRRILPFSTLPKDCIGHVAMPMGDSLYVGGHSKSGEALWRRYPTRHPDAWEALALPATIRQPGKAIDGLHMDGDQLLAVDDIVVPKWLLPFRVGPGTQLTALRPVLMPTHMTHERIVRSYLGEEVLWLVSRGVNHGKVGSFVWGLSLETFRSRGYWSATSSDIDDEQVAQQYLLDACGVMEWQGRLLVPCGKHGLWQVRLRKKRTNFHNDPMLPVHLTTLASVRELRLVSGSNTDGVFAIGEDESGMLVQEWVSRGLVESAG